MMSNYLSACLGYVAGVVWGEYRLVPLFKPFDKSLQTPKIPKGSTPQRPQDVAFWQPFSCFAANNILQGEGREGGEGQWLYFDLITRSVSIRKYSN